MRVNVNSWYNTGILTVILKDHKLPCSEGNVESPVETVCLTGNVLLYSMGFSDYKYVPLGSMIVLLAACVGLGLVLFPVLLRPLQRSRVVKAGSTRFGASAKNPSSRLQGDIKNMPELVEEGSMHSLEMVRMTNPMMG